MPQGQFPTQLPHDDSENDVEVRFQMVSGVDYLVTLSGWQFYKIHEEFRLTQKQAAKVTTVDFYHEDTKRDVQLALRYVVAIESQVLEPGQRSGRRVEALLD